MKMMVANSIFVDTNILIYSTNTLSPFFATATAMLEEARKGGFELVISSQIIREYIAVATRQYVTVGSPSLDDILKSVEVIRTTLRIIPDSLPVLDHLINLVRTVAVAGKQIHDANIVATIRRKSTKS